MTTQYTPILKLALPVTGELSGTWGDVVNDNITSMVEQAIAGLATISTWAANSHTLSTANGTTSEARCAMLVAQDGAGLTAAGEIVCPASSKLYVLKNGTSYAITLKTAAGTGVAVASGDTAFLFCDGTNVNSCVTTIVNGHITGNLTVDGNATVNGNTTLGNANTDTVTFTARVASDVLPSADNTYDLGSSANSWKSLWIDGTATMALVAISGGTIDGVSIGATTPATIINVDNLSLNGNTISSTDTNGNIVIAPNGTGDVQLDADTVRVGDAAAPVTLTSNGAGALTVTTGGASDITISTNGGTNSGAITIANGANGNITLTPNGTGDVILSADTVQVGDLNTDAYITTNGTGNLNLTTNNGTNSGTIQIAQGANGNITLTPNGTGLVSIPSMTLSGGTANGVAYLNGSKVLTTGSALTFDGASLRLANAVGTTANGLQLDGGAQAHYWYLSDNVTSAYEIGSGSGQWKWLNSNGEQMRLTSTGLGIGTSSPSYKLDVNGTGRISLMTFTPDGTYSAPYQTIGFSGNTNGKTRIFGTTNDSDNLYLAAGTGRGITFWVNGSSATAAALDSSGNLGIGTSSPGEKLDVRSSGNAIGNFQSSSASGYAGINANNGSRNWYAGIRADASNGFGIRDETAGATRLLIDSSGNLGLGVTPSAWGTSGLTALQIRGVGFMASDTQSWVFANAYFDGATTRYINNGFSTYYRQNDGGAHKWYTAASGTAGDAITFTQAMTLDASGQLTVAATGVDHTFGAGNNANSSLRVMSNPVGATYYQQIELLANGSNQMFIRNMNSELRFIRNSTQQMTLDASGRLGVGQTSPSYVLDTYDTVGQARFSRNKTTTGDMGGLVLGGLNAISSAISYALVQSTASTVTSGAENGNLDFYTMRSGSITQAARIDSSGNFGLGATPSAVGAYKIMEINGTAGGILYMQTAGTRALQLYGSSGESGLWMMGNGALIFATNNTERARIDSSGNLLIGATSGSNKLTVNGNGIFLANGQARFADAGNNQISYITNSGAANTSQLEFWTGATPTERARIDSSGTFRIGDAPTSNSLQLGTTSGGVYTEAARIGLNSGALTFLVASTTTEAMRIDTSRNLLVGTTSSFSGTSFYQAGSGIYVSYFRQADASNPLGLLVNYSGASPNGTGNAFFEGNDTTTARVVLRSNGGIANYQANDANLSDRREKTNFAPAGEYLSKICAIPVQTFNYIDQNMEEDPGTTLGVVAQDVQAVAPELVSESNWGTKEDPKMRLSIYQTDLQYALMKCIQEQQVIIDSLKARLDAANL